MDLVVKQLPLAKVKIILNDFGCVCAVSPSANFVLCWVESSITAHTEGAAGCCQCVVDRTSDWEVPVMASNSVGHNPQPPIFFFLMILVWCENGPPPRVCLKTTFESLMALFYHFTLGMHLSFTHLYPNSPTFWVSSIINVKLLCFSSCLKWEQKAEWLLFFKLGGLLSEVCSLLLFPLHHAVGPVSVASLVCCFGEIRPLCCLELASVYLGMDDTLQRSWTDHSWWLSPGEISQAFFSIFPFSSFSFFIPWKWLSLSYIPCQQNVYEVYLIWKYMELFSLGIGFL